MKLGLLLVECNDCYGHNSFGPYLASIANGNEKPQFLFFSKKSQTISVVEAKLVQFDLLLSHYLFIIYLLITYLLFI